MSEPTEVERLRQELKTAKSELQKLNDQFVYFQAESSAKEKALNQKIQELQQHYEKHNVPPPPPAALPKNPLPVSPRQLAINVGMNNEPPPPPPAPKVVLITTDIPITPLKQRIMSLEAEQVKMVAAPTKGATALKSTIGVQAIKSKLEQMEKQQLNQISNSGLRRRGASLGITPTHQQRAPSSPTSKAQSSPLHMAASSSNLTEGFTSDSLHSMSSSTPPQQQLIKELPNTPTKSTTETQQVGSPAHGEPNHASDSVVLSKSEHEALTRKMKKLELELASVEEEMKNALEALKHEQERTKEKDKQIDSLLELNESYKLMIAKLESMAAKPILTSNASTNTLTSTTSSNNINITNANTTSTNNGTPQQPTETVTNTSKQIEETTNNNGAPTPATESQQVQQEAESLAEGVLRSSGFGRPIGTVKVLWDFQSRDDFELNLKSNDIITVLQKHHSGMWIGELRGKIGRFPSNYCSEIVVLKPQHKLKGKKRERQIQTLILKLQSDCGFIKGGGDANPDQSTTAVDS